MRQIARETVISLGATAIVILLCCVFYPVAVYAIGQVAFRGQANGSLVDKNGDAVASSEAVGSSLLGQGFKTPEYFHPRPSAAGAGYDAANSSGTNLGPISEKLLNGATDDPSTKDVDESFAGVKQLVATYRSENGLGDDTLVPADAVTRSASGLDPDITPANAGFQIARVAKARGVTEERVREILEHHIQGRDLGIFGEPRVNVLMLNLALDREVPKTQHVAPGEHGGIAATQH
jgi:potassium-transporting ATPase KdpC subunit